MWVIFNNNDRMTGYATVPFSTDDEARTVVEMEVSDLESELADEYESWKDHRRGFILENESGPEIAFDEEYSPE